MKCIRVGMLALLVPLIAVCLLYKPQTAVAQTKENGAAVSIFSPSLNPTIYYSLGKPSIQIHWNDVFRIEADILPVSAVPPKEVNGGFPIDTPSLHRQYAKGLKDYQVAHVCAPGAYLVCFQAGFKPQNTSPLLITSCRVNVRKGYVTHVIPPRGIIKYTSSEATDTVLLIQGGEALCPAGKTITVPVLPGTSKVSIKQEPLTGELDAASGLMQIKPAQWPDNKYIGAANGIEEFSLSVTVSAGKTFNLLDKIGRILVHWHGQAHPFDAYLVNTWNLDESREGWKGAGRLSPDKELLLNVAPGSHKFRIRWTSNLITSYDCDARAGCIQEITPPCGQVTLRWQGYGEDKFRDSGSRYVKWFLFDAEGKKSLSPHDAMGTSSFMCVAGKEQSIDLPPGDYRTDFGIEGFGPRQITVEDGKSKVIEPEIGQILFQWQHSKDERQLGIFDKNGKLVAKYDSGKKTDAPVGEYVGRLLIFDLTAYRIANDSGQFPVVIRKNELSEITR